MSLVVQKFGGTSVADADRIRAVADHVARSRRAGDDVVVVVSAMGHTTDELVRLADDVSSVQPTREVDMLLSAGERISMSLLCMALAELGVEATSYTGSQAGIITDAVHTRARIVEIKADRLQATLAGGGVPVVAGFQGMSVERDVTTLGRGGSDTTAVALAAVLDADVCAGIEMSSTIAPASRKRRAAAQRQRAIERGCGHGRFSSSEGTSSFRGEIFETDHVDVFGRDVELVARPGPFEP